jgi:hypothetical protein
MLTAIVAVVSLGAGFGLGRIKNVAKLAAVKAELDKVQGSVIGEVAALVAAVRAKL